VRANRLLSVSVKIPSPGEQQQHAVERWRVGTDRDDHPSLGAD
jgi:hypothetical protein